MLKEAFCQAAYRSGLLALASAWRESRDLPPGDRCFQILTYHRVGDDGDAYVPATSVSGFECHMRCLREHFRPLSLSDLLAAAERREVPPRAVAVTFDDGYEDTFIHAFPIIQRYEIPVTVYLATGLIGQDASMFNDRVGGALRVTDRTEIDALPELGPLPLRTPPERQAALQRILQILKRRPPAEREDLTASIERALGVSTNGAPHMLRWEQVQEMHAAGIDFGGHTVHHPILSGVPADEAEREIAQSKRMIEERLQAPARHFAYPNGTPQDFDASTAALVARAGFASAASTIFGVNTASTDRYALRRGGPWEEDAATFTAKLWWYRWRGNQRP
jgi:peptidoglycan/xylan/chitin deacetylase (PgdA/CDA1 family)